MLVTEKIRPIGVFTETGEKTRVAAILPVLPQGQDGILGDRYFPPVEATDPVKFL